MFRLSRQRLVRILEQIPAGRLEITAKVIAVIETLAMTVQPRVRPRDGVNNARNGKLIRWSPSPRRNT